MSAMPKLRPGSNDELLPNRVDQIAESDPERIWAEFPASSSSYDDGFVKLNYRQLANAVNGAASWIVDEFGVGLQFDTIAFSGPNDVRTPIAVLGAVKAGYKILLTSPRNSIAAHKHLFKQTRCRYYVVADPEPPHVQSLCAHLGIQPRFFPSLQTLFSVQHERYLFNKTFGAAKMEPLVVIHTSGSTGLPKPLIIPHLFATRYANNHHAPPPNGSFSQSPFFHGVRLIHTLPMFHAAGVYHSIISTIFSGTCYIFLKPDAPPTAQGIADALERTTASAIFVAPSVVEEIGKSERLLDLFAEKLEAICFAGGGLSKPLGDCIAQRMRLISLYGSSELGQGIQLRKQGIDDDRDWSYQRWDESASGMEFREETSGLYQLVLVKGVDRERHQPPFAVFPDADEFYTKDLFKPHPLKKGLWAHAGRTDDIIVLSNGEKINPVSMEGQIFSHPRVSSAIVVGEGRFHTILLVEVKEPVPKTPSDRAKLIDELWFTVELANELAPRHARLSKSHVLFTDPEKPMCRAGKGTIIRKATLALYEREIDALYEILESNIAASGTPWTSNSLKHFQDRADTVNFISNIIRDLTGWKDVDCGSNLFSLGVDSLQVIMLVRQIKIQVYKPNISVDMIYSNPSIDALCDALLQPGESLVGREPAEKDTIRIERVCSKLARYTSKIDKIEPVALEARATAIATQSVTGCTVMLTGSSGFAGSYILRQLLDNPWVKRIYCLDRPSGSEKGSLRGRRERASNYERMLQDDRAHTIRAVLSKVDFGLPEAEFAKLKAMVDVVIHAAWAVDFNQKLDAYDEQLQGMVGLFSFISQSTKAPPLLYISSISSVQNCAGPVPEAMCYDPLMAAKTGYGESKHIAERLVDYAATKLNHKNLILRAGQIAGPQSCDGGWNRHEWLPSLVTSSAYLGALPDSLGAGQKIALAGEMTLAQMVDWVPVDLFAQVAIDMVKHLLTPAKELLHQQGSRRASIAHVVNPKLSAWSDLLPTIKATLNGYQYAGEEREAIKVVPFAEWVSQLEASADKGATDMETLTRKCPAIKLLAFFQGRASGDGELAPLLDTTFAQSISPSLSRAAPLSPKVFQTWIHGWLG